MDERDLNSFSRPNKKVYKKKKKRGWWARRSRTQRVIVISAVSVMLCALAVVAAVVGYAYHLLNSLERDENFVELDSSEIGFIEELDEDVYNIALFGVDTREEGDFSGNSDSIMILSVQKVQNQVKIVSVMRDSLVPIESDEGTVYKKVNAAYHLGGPTLAIKTLNQLFGLDIRDYATVNFYGMGDIIDAVGGIEATITESELENELGINAMIDEQCGYLDLNPQDYFVWEPGTQKLNGVQAVAYARIRYAQSVDGNFNDFGRVERQHYVMQQLLNKALDLEVTAYPRLVKSLLPYVKTSLTNGELLSLAMVLKGKPQLLQTRVPSDEYIINEDFRGTGASTVYYNYEYAGEIIRAFLYDGITPEDYMLINGVNKTEWYNQ